MNPAEFAWPNVSCQFSGCLQQSRGLTVCVKAVSREHEAAWSSAAGSSRAPAVEHVGEQTSWSGLHMLRSGVQAVSVTPVHGGQLGGTWEVGSVHGRWGGGSCSTSIVPGGQELSRTQQESGGPFLKSDQLALLFSHPAHFILLYISSSPSLFPRSSLPFLSLVDWYTGWNVIFLCVLWDSVLTLLFPIPPTRPANLFSAGIKLSHSALFFNHLVHIKVTHERMAKRRKGPGTRQISLAFPSHNASHLNSPIYCWSL